LWLPYYVWGVRLGSKFLGRDDFLQGALIIAGTTLFGFIGLHLLQRFFITAESFSVANFRVLLIVSTQLMAVVLIAIDSKFNWLAITAGLIVILGAVIGAYAIER